MKIDRIIGIITILLQQEKATAPYLAEKFEVSRRTILRDIESISQAGIPIVTEQGQNGGISIMSGYTIDRTVFTSAEMNAILTGLQSLDSVSGTKQYQQLMEKLSVGTSKSIPVGGAESFTPGTGVLINLSTYHKSTLIPKIDLVRNAIQTHHLIEFTYFSPRGETVRTIEPYLLTFWWASWYVWGYCVLRNGFRLFKLNRMCSVCDSQNFFLPRSLVPAPESAFDAKSVAHIPVVIRFSPEVKWRVIDEFGADYAFDKSDDEIIVRGKFMDKSSLFSMLLSYGACAELIDPPELRAEFGIVTNAIAEKYMQLHKKK